MQLSSARTACAGERQSALLIGEAVALGALLLVALVVRWKVFSPAELGLDGYLSVGLASISWREMLDFSIRDVHPPLYYGALEGWLAAAGPTVAAARWPSVACGLLSILVLSRIVRSSSGPLAGLVAAALLTATPAHIYLSATVRDFSPGLLLSLAATWLALDLARDDVRAGSEPRPRARLGGQSGRLRLGLLALLNALAIHVWYFHAVFVVAQVVILVVSRPKWLARSLGAITLGLLTCLPWVLYAAPALFGKLSDGTTVGGNARGWVPLGDFLRQLGPNLVGDLPGTPSDGPAAAGLAGLWLGLAVLGCVVGVTSARSRSARAPYVASLVGLLLGLSLVYALRAGWVGNDNPSRYLLIVIPFGIVGQTALVGRAGGRGALAIALGLMLLVASGALAFERTRAIPPIQWANEPTLVYLRQNVRPGDAVLVSDLADVGVYRLLGLSRTPIFQVHFAGSEFLWADVERDAPRVVAALAARYDRVWFADHAPNHEVPGTRVNYQLASAFYLADRRWESKSLDLRLYQAGPRPALRPTDLPFGGQIRLAGVAAAIDEPGAGLYLTFDWQTLRRPDKDYSIFIHVVGAGEKTIAQRDGSPQAGLSHFDQQSAGDRMLDYEFVRLPDQLPDGDYEVRTGLYSGDARLTLLDGKNFVVVGRLRRASGQTTVIP